MVNIITEYIFTPMSYLDKFIEQLELGDIGLGLSSRKKLRLGHVVIIYDLNGWEHLNEFLYPFILDELVKNFKRIIIVEERIWYGEMYKVPTIKENLLFYLNE